MEKVNVYRIIDGKRVKVDKIYIRNSSWEEGEEDLYIVGVNNWIINSEGKFLVQRRSLTKKNNPGKWSSTNGLVQLGEDRFETVQRETKEELGIDIDKKQIYLIEENHIVGDHLMVDIFVTYADVKLSDIIIQESEVDKVCYVTKEELLDLDVSTTCSHIKTLASKIYEDHQKNN